MRRSTGTATETSRKANSVPMLTRSASAPSGTKAAMTRTSAAKISVMRTGVPVRGLTLADLRGQQAVAAHREADPASW